MKHRGEGNGRGLKREPPEVSQKKITYRMNLDTSNRARMEHTRSSRREAQVQRRRRRKSILASHAVADEEMRQPATVFHQSHVVVAAVSGAVAALLSPTFAMQLSEDTKVSDLSHLSHTNRSGLSVSSTSQKRLSTTDGMYLRSYCKGAVCHLRRFHEQLSPPEPLQVRLCYLYRILSPLS